MRDIVLTIPEKEYPFFVELIKKFDFVTIKNHGDHPPTKEEFVNGLREAVIETNEIKAGKQKGQPLKDFLNELW